MGGACLDGLFFAERKGQGANGVQPAGCAGQHERCAALAAGERVVQVAALRQQVLQQHAQLPLLLAAACRAGEHRRQDAVGVLQVQLLIVQRVLHERSHGVEVAEAGCCFEGHAAGARAVPVGRPRRGARIQHRPACALVRNPSGLGSTRSAVTRHCGCCQQVAAYGDWHAGQQQAGPA